jgi:tape measure domain-containing protein
VSVVANVALNLDTRGVPQKLRDVQGQAQQTERAFDSLGNTVGRLVKAYAAFQAVKFVFTQTAEIESQAKSLQVLTGSAEKATQIIKQLQDLGAATPFTSSELIDAAKRLQAFGVATDNVVETTRRLADVSGATGAELQGLVTAYGQVQAKGRLQGEELLQFQERGVALQKVLKEEYKLSGDQFQKALEKGQIGAASVEYAIKKLTDAGGKYANGAIAQSDTLNGKLSTLQDSFQRLAQNIGKFFEPVFKFLIDGVNAFLERLNNAQRIGVEARAYQEANIRTQNKFGRLRAANPFDAEVQQYRERLRKSLVTSGMGAGAAPMAPSVPAGAAPSLLTPTGNKAGVDKAARDAKRLAEELKRSLETGDQLGRQFSNQVIQLSATSEIEKKRNEIQFQYEERARQIGELKNQEQKLNLTTLNDEIRRLEIIQLQRDELKGQISDFYDRVGLQAKQFGGGQGAFRTDINLDPSAQTSEAEKMKQKLDELVKAENQVKLGAEAMGSAFGQTFRDLISGTTSAQEAFASMMQSIADHFLDMAAQIITQQITMIIYGTIMKALGIGGGGGLFSGAGPVSGAQAFGPGGPSFNPAAFGGTQLFAEGGYVTGPTRAVVGEAGNEYVIPASKMRGAMNRYAAGARGSAVIPAGDGGDNGTATMVAAPGAIDVRYTVERINSVDYVTADQFQQGMQQAAQQGAAQGEQRTLRRLQMSTSTRKRLGM